MITIAEFGARTIKVMCDFILLFIIVQNLPLALELSKYQTLPGKRSKKSELRSELNGEGDGEYLSPVQLSPIHSCDQDYSLSEFLCP